MDFWTSPLFEFVFGLTMFKQRSDIDVPARQRWLRDACCAGDVRRVQKLLEPKAKGWGNWLMHLLCLGDEEAPVLSFIHVEDHCRTPLHYIASGVSNAHRAIEDVYTIPDMTLDSRNARERAALMQWIFQRNYSVDLNASDSGGKSVVEWAVLSRSVEVLEVLVNEANAQGVNLNISDADHAESSALDLALASQQWTVVQLLIKAGALKDSLRLRNAVESLAEFAPDVIDAAPSKGARPKVGWSFAGLFSGAVGSLFSDAQSSMTHTSSTLSLTGEDEDPVVEDTSHGRPQIFSSMQEVEEFWDRQARYVSAVCSIDLSSAHRLLKEHAHDVDSAIKAHMQSTSTSGDATASCSKSMSKHSAHITCCVCYDDFPASAQLVAMPCGHSNCCNNCWTRYIKARMDDGQACSIQCPEPGCSLTLPLSDARKLLPADIYQKLQRQVLQSYVDSNPSIKWCPRPGCGCSISLADQLRKRNLDPASVPVPTTSLTVRCTCGYAFCWHCLDESHEPALCSQVKSWRDLEEEEKKEGELESSSWMQHNTQSCCNCGAHVQRLEGCNHMVCSVCGQHFCYMCGSDWASHGPHTGGYYVCTLAPDQSSILASPLYSAVSQVGNMLKSAWRIFYTRQAQYMRRYYAQSDDAGELKRVLHHIARILQAAMPGGDSDTPFDLSAMLNGSLRNTAAPPDASYPSSSPARSLIPYPSTPPPSNGIQFSFANSTASLTRPPPSRSVAGANEASPIQYPSCNQRSALSVPSSAADSDGGCAPVARDELDPSAMTQNGELSQLGRRNSWTFSNMAHPLAHLDSWEHSRHGCQGNVDAGEGTCEQGRCACGVVTCPFYGERGGAVPGEQGKVAGHIRQRSGTLGGLLTDWERTVAKGRKVLRNTYIATYFMERCNERQHLETLQGKLEGQVGQLAALLSRLPHRQDVLEDAESDAAQGDGQARAIDPGLEGQSSLHSCVILLFQWIGQAILCLGHSLVNSDKYSDLRRMPLEGFQVRDQFYYVIALHLHRARIVRLLRHVNRTCQSIVKIGKVKMEPYTSDLRRHTPL